MSNATNPDSSQFFKSYTTKLKHEVLRKSQSRLLNVNTKIQKEIAQGQTEVNQIEDLIVLKTEPSHDINAERLTKIKKEKEMLKHKIEEMNQSIHQLQYLETLNRKNQLLNNSSRLNLSMSQSRIVQKKWKISMHERSKRIQSKKKDIEERFRKRQLNDKLEQQKQKKLEEQRKKSQLKERIKKIQERALTRTKENQQSVGKLKTLVKSRKLFQKMTSLFKKKENRKIKEMQDKLSMIKSSHKPLDSEQLKMHEQKFQEMRKQRSQLRLKRTLEILERANSYKAPYQSKYYKRILGQSKQLQQSRYSLADSRYKIKEFSENVRKNIIPKIDQQKRAFIQQMKKVPIDNRSKEEKERERWELIHNKGKQTIEYLRKLPKKAKQNVQPIQASNAKPKYQNYLTHSVNTPQQKTWKKIIANEKLSKESKLAQLKCEFEKLQQKQSFKKMKKSALKQNTDFGQNLDDQYMEMVRAKLEIINSVN